MYSYGVFLFVSIGWNKDQDTKIKDLESQIETLVHYKKVCKKKTQEQNEINNDHGSVIEYLRETNPDLKPAIDLDEIKDIEAK